MRTVNSIVGAVQEQQPVTEQELRLALLCLYYDGQMACQSDYEGVSESRLRMRAKENFARRFRMLKSEPDKYLGPRWTPGTPENAEGRELSKRILAKFEAQKDKA